VPTELLPNEPMRTVTQQGAGSAASVRCAAAAAPEMRGLTEQQAAERLQAAGYNELSSTHPRGHLALVREVLSEPMLFILVATGIVYLILGDIGEAIALLIAIFLIIGIEIRQERKTERTLEALRNLSSPRALVIRDGARRRIPGREVVRGDLVIISEGDRVPADAVLLESDSLTIDESLLTGESVPVRKRPGVVSGESSRPGGDDSPLVFSGTMVVQGRGVAAVLATGGDTEMGKIGKSVSSLQTERTTLQKETDHVVRIFAVFGLMVCALVVVLYGASRGSWLQGVLAGLSLAVAMVPEEFPVVLTVFLALGAWRISRAKVLTRRIPAVEMLGAATVLCVDKTGTLTQNRMSVRRFWAKGRSHEVSLTTQQTLPEEFHEILEYSILASRQDPFDPMEKAFVELGETFLRQTEHLHADWTLVREYPLTSELLAMSRAWRPTAPDGHVVAAKGAPEAIAHICGLEGGAAREILDQSNAMGEDGLRVLGVAFAQDHGATLPASQRDFPFEFVGLVGLADPVSEGVPQAIQEAQHAGIRVVMITGDYPATARSIARQIGLDGPESVITGAELDQMSDAQLRDAVRRARIFARVVPEQKLRLVSALRANGEVVAMTGDGVNDAPALKAAHIGIAMGARGTDVARESAALVLLDDRFPSIVHAVRLGRRIFDNLEKAITFALAVHIPIAGVTLIPLLLGWPLILLPLHIVLLELIIDPACSVAFEAEPEEPDVMERPPRDPGRRLFNRENILSGLRGGAVILLTVLAVLWWTVVNRYGEQDVRAITFTTLVLGNVALIFVSVSRNRPVWSVFGSSNRTLWWLTGAAVGLLLLALYVPPLRELFRFSVMHPHDLAISIAMALSGVLVLEAIKFAKRRGRPTR
jgi:P-type Ca2+ transporter type 2C